MTRAKRMGPGRRAVAGPGRVYEIKGYSRQARRARLRGALRGSLAALLGRSRG